jgi:hydrogenase maturation protease
MNKNRKIIIIGIGNLLLMDEGIGIYVINELEKHRLPQNVEIYDGGTGGFKLIDLMHGADEVIFVDAIDAGKAPGVITTFNSKDVCRVYRGKKYSLHDTGLLEVLEMANILDNTSEIKIVGVQPKTIKYGTMLSQELRDSIPRIINVLFKEIGEPSNILPASN